MDLTEHRTSLLQMNVRKWATLSVVVSFLMFSLTKSNEIVQTEGVQENIWKKSTDSDVCQWAKENNQTVGVSYAQITKLRSLPFTTDQLDYLRSLHPTIQTRQQRAVRKDIRQLNEEELTIFRDAMWSMKLDYIGNISRFDIFSDMHMARYAPSSNRAGPGQFPWHREYMLRFEEGLRRFANKISLPYWDLTLDNALPRTFDSIVWSDKFYGPCRFNGVAFPLGEVNTGPYANWPLPSYCDTDHLARGCGIRSDNQGMSDEELETIEDFDSYSEMVQTVGNCFTRDHDLMHYFIFGTSTGDKRCVVQDPAAWGFHVFIDYVLEEFRADHQEPSTLEKDYPNDDTLYESNHGAYAAMHPFSFYNIDGLSTDYTDYFYTYQRRKMTCNEDSDCGDTTVLWCQKSNKRCMSKIVTDGSCKDISPNVCKSSDKCNSQTNKCVGTKSK